MYDGFNGMQTFTRHVEGFSDYAPLLKELDSKLEVLSKDKTYR